MYTSDVLQSSFSQIGADSAEIWIFFFFVSSKNFKWDFLKVHFSKFALCSTDFDKLRRISTYIHQSSYSQIVIGSAEIWIFFFFISSKNFKHNFLKSTFFKIHTLYMLVFQVLWCNMPCIFWNMLKWVPTTQFCEKLKVHFSNIGNLFLGYITYAKSAAACFHKRLTDKFLKLKFLHTFSMRNVFSLNRKSDYFNWK